MYDVLKTRGIKYLNVDTRWWFSPLLAFLATSLLPVTSSS